LDRRSFITKAGLAGAGACRHNTCRSGDRASSPKVTWRLASAFPKSLDTIYGGAEVFSKMMSKRPTNFQVQVFAAAKSSPLAGSRHATAAGTVERRIPSPTIPEARSDLGARRGRFPRSMRAA
jgi:TRAP-type mannitol/chloroaromatic compound transport system substrate-binding protein